MSEHTIKRLGPGDYLYRDFRITKMITGRWRIFMGPDDTHPKMGADTDTRQVACQRIDTHLKIEARGQA